jgi:hypothetical protein
MSETLSILPISFWVVIVLVVAGAGWAWQRRNDGTGLPTLAVLGTVTAWYVGDAFYNDYANNHAKMFDAATLTGAWWQVALFLTAFLLAVPAAHRLMNRRFLQRQSGVMQISQRGVDDPAIQQQLKVLFRGCSTIWILLAIIALVMLGSLFPYYLFPFLGFKATPWSHGRVGAGFDALSVIAIYLQLLAASMFGVVAALATDRRVRRLALVFCLLSWPYFIFDRTRNMMLALVIPGVMSWVFLRLRGGLLKRIGVLLACFLLVNAWMKFVIANRSHTSIAAAFQHSGLDLGEQKRVHNEGLNMFEELCWVSTFIDNGAYRPNWGARYLAELVNPIPRALWHNKPMIGLDYAMARGHGQADDTQGGVNTTISTGMIGQGVVNFGRVLGPLAAAILMSLWVAWLARLDLNIQALGRLPGYCLGLILTFNLGRDITLITLYPFMFGALAVWWLDHRKKQTTGTEPTTPTRSFQPERLPNPPSLFARRTPPRGFIRMNQVRPSRTGRQRNSMNPRGDLHGPTTTT